MEASTMREQIQASMMRETHPGFYDEGINPGLSNEGHTSFESNAQEKKEIPHRQF